MRWKIFYGDGSTYDDSQSPWNAPAVDVQALLVDDPDHGWYCCRADQYYWYMPEEDRWYSGDLFGFYDYLTQPGQKKVVFGRSIPDAEYRAILDRAMSDPDLPAKTGWQRNERRP